ncbi:hypothetical protein GNF10_32775 [Nostoc sp. UCD121]|nr:MULTISPECIES: hypothetical protein [unclassified Nostoc]MBC1225359.1 hypothetical protein [Nostoc sp. UCD120]MBC1280586.1 hypothetical protein [Nostoc sp. UCD121]MBC1298950.1 hypothetical protein [Nostoc sp. UCD122]
MRHRIARRKHRSRKRGYGLGAIAGASSLRDTTRVRLNAANSTFASAR